MSIFDFTEEDLKSNKRGQLSPRQKEWLKMVARGFRSFSWKSALITIAFTFLGLCIVLALYLQNQDTRAALFSNPVNLIMFPVIMVVIMGILALVIFLNYRNANRLENSNLLSAEGKIHLEEDSSGESGVTSHYVLVGKKRFAFGEDISRVFKEGAKHKVYYCKSGVYEFVLSLERVIN